jgi:hypothetical protein
MLGLPREQWETKIKLAQVSNLTRALDHALLQNLTHSPFGCAARTTLISIQWEFKGGALG